MIERIRHIARLAALDGKRLNQHLPEFAAWLLFAASHLSARGVGRPVVVEIGILDGAQRRFYEELLGAEYIGLDIDPKAPAEIRGRSSDPRTAQALRERLGGRPIDVLFIDGLHTYEGAKADFEIYGAMTRHLVALHDIHTPKLHPGDPVEVYRLWAEILEGNRTDTIVEIRHHNPRRPEEFNGRPLGIGVLVKGGAA